MKAKNLLQNILIAGAVAILLLTGFSLFKLHETRTRIARSVVAGSDFFEAGIADLGNLEPRQAAEKLRTAYAGFDSFDDITKNFLPLLKSNFGIYRSFQSLIGYTFELAQELVWIENGAIKLMTTGRGSEVTARLEKVNSLLASISAENIRLASSSSEIKGFSPSAFDFYIPLQLTATRVHEFLDEFIPWFKAPAPSHMAVLLGNTSEMRPAGGFIGSYIDLVLRGGNIEQVNVHDINDSDRELKENIIPPRPIQAIAARFKAADANWFFNIPDSSRKVIELMESSDLYRAASTTFEGAVLITPKVVADLLELTGPLVLPQSKVTVDSKNFLSEIQKEIERSRSERASYPKQVLTELAPRLIERLSAFDDNQNAALILRLPEWIKKRDLIIYFKNRDFQKFFGAYGAVGEIYNLPRSTNTGYLAVVSANIGSGKTDLVIKQDIALQVQLNSDGTVSNHIVISREHQGGNYKEKWYRLPNETYFKVFTVPSAKLVGATGVYEKKIKPSVNYRTSGYKSDSLIESIESTALDLSGYQAVESFSEAGKNVFGLWSRVGLGETKKITLDYTHRLPLGVRDGVPYEFVFEKQPGSRNAYAFEFSAPVGYVWRENGLPVYEYRTDDPPGRISITLTPRKI